MTIRDVRHAHQVADALMRFFDDLYTDEPVGPDEGLSSDEALMAKRLSRGLHATLDACVRRVHSQRGFTLLSVLVAMALSMLVIGALSTAMMANARLAATLSKVAHEESQGRARLARCMTSNVLDPVPSPQCDAVTVTIDPTTAPDAPCRLYHLETQANTRTLDAYAARGCASQP